MPHEAYFLVYLRSRGFSASFLKASSLLRSSSCRRRVSSSFCFLSEIFCAFFACVCCCRHCAQPIRAVESGRIWRERDRASAREMMHACMYACVRACGCVCVHVNMCVCMHACKFACRQHAHFFMHACTFCMPRIYEYHLRVSSRGHAHLRQV